MGLGKLRDMLRVNPEITLILTAATSRQTGRTEHQQYCEKEKRGALT